MQIGTNDQVFLIQVTTARHEFLHSLSNSLHRKRLVHWGGSDENDVCRLLPELTADWFDLQRPLSPDKDKGILVGLDTRMEAYLQGFYSLSKEWTLSGWDLPILDDRQKSYAALDVASCHILYLKYKPGLDSLDMFQCHDQKFHSFFTLNEWAARVKHGLSFEREFCCHYDRGKLIKGLFIEPLQDGRSSVIPRGFRATTWTETESTSFVPQFVHMLNAQMFCCRCCSDLKWFEATGLCHCPEFKVQQNYSGFFCCLRSGTTATPVPVRIPPEFQSCPLHHHAYLCLSMLGYFLKCKLGAINATHLANSVLADCRYGFISDTLSFLQQ
jgi:hypothetical protein